MAPKRRLWSSVLGSFRDGTLSFSLSYGRNREVI